MNGRPTAGEQRMTQPGQPLGAANQGSNHRTISAVSVVLAVSSFLLGAAAAAFLAAWFVRRSAPSATPGSVPVGPTGKPAGLSQRVLGALDLGVVVVDRDEIAVYANPVARTLQVVDADRIAVPALA